MIGLGLALTIGNPIFRGPSGYTEAQVEAGAGITSGVTPGVLDRATGLVAGVYSTDYGISPGDGSTQTDKVGFAVFNITSEAAMSGKAGFTVTGNGDLATPWLVQNCLIYSPSTVASAFTWNHPGADYHIKFKNCAFITPQANMNLFDIIDSGTGTLTLEDCQLGGNNAGTSTFALVKVVVGSVIASRCFITYASGFSFWAAGATASITVNDSMFDTTGGPWPGAFSSPALFNNTVAGGVISVSRTTVDHKSVAPFVKPNRNCAVTLDRVYWNSSNSATPQSFIPTNTTDMAEAWTSGLTMTDCKLYTGSAAVTLFGWQDLTINRGVSNVSIEHCDFEMTVGRPGAGNAFMIALGNASTGASGDLDNISIRWTKFTKPVTPIVSGNEVIYLVRATDSLIEACWVVSCGEDAYEFHQPYANCIVRYCGGTSVNGNMVDFYAAHGAAGADKAWSSADGNTGGHQAHHIFGECRGDALIIDCVHGVDYHHIDVTNDVGTPFPTNPPAANVRLHWRSSSGVPSLNGVTGANTLTAPGDSYAGKPAELTYETGSDTYATSAPAIALDTLSWQEWNGSGWDTRGCEHGIVDNMA